MTNLVLIFVSVLNDIRVCASPSLEEFQERVNSSTVPRSNKGKDVILKYGKFWKHQESNSQQCQKPKRFGSILRSPQCNTNRTYIIS